MDGRGDGRTNKISLLTYATKEMMNKQPTSQDSEYGKSKSYTSTSLLKSRTSNEMGP